MLCALRAGTQACLLTLYRATGWRGGGGAGDDCWWPSLLAICACRMQAAQTRACWKTAVRAAPLQNEGRRRRQRGGTPVLCRALPHHAGVEKAAGRRRQA